MNKKWNALPDSFVNERLGYVKGLAMNDLVYVHGDLNKDNILVDDNNTLTIIDFADALLAPREYELAVLICEVFDFSQPYLEGFFGIVDLEDLTDKCLKGILIHEFGPTIIKDNIGHIDEINNIAVLKSKIYNALKYKSC